MTNQHRGSRQGRAAVLWCREKFLRPQSPDQDKCLCTSSTFSTTHEAHRTKMKAAQSQSGLCGRRNFSRHHNTAARPWRLPRCFAFSSRLRRFRPRTEYTVSGVFGTCCLSCF